MSDIIDLIRMAQLPSLPMDIFKPLAGGRRIGPRRARGKTYPYNSIRAQQRGSRQIRNGMIRIDSGLVEV